MSLSLELSASLDILSACLRLAERPAAKANRSGARRLPLSPTGPSLGPIGPAAEEAKPIARAAKESLVTTGVGPRSALKQARTLAPAANDAPRGRQDFEAVRADATRATLETAWRANLHPPSRPKSSPKPHLYNPRRRPYPSRASRRATAASGPSPPRRATRRPRRPRKPRRRRGPLLLEDRAAARRRARPARRRRPAARRGRRARTRSSRDSSKREARGGGPPSPRPCPVGPESSAESGGTTSSTPRCRRRPLPSTK